MANGAKVNSKRSLLLLGEIIKITTPIIKAKMIFLKEDNKTKGRLERVVSNVNRKNSAIGTNNDNAIF